jgi:hypothetical protein
MVERGASSGEKEPGGRVQVALAAHSWVAALRYRKLGGWVFPASRLVP